MPGAASCLLVLAPAGYGKTTVLGEWSSESTRPVAWVSLDETDNDPTHFWSYLVTSPTLSAQDVLFELLRPREIKVLQHVALGRSNTEIADEMIMAVSTVKWYLRNIYGKLLVHRRTQAVARARELNLL